jgi:hypothetical protein
MELTLPTTMQVIVPVHRPALPEDEGRRERINQWWASEGPVYSPTPWSFSQGRAQQILSVQRQTLAKRIIYAFN